MKARKTGFILGLLLLMMMCFETTVFAATTTKSVSFKQCTVKFTVPYSGNWSIQKTDSWMNAKKSGKTLIITVGKNKGEARSGSVIVKKGSKSKTYRINQGAYDLLKDRFKYDWMKCNKKDVTLRFMKKVVQVCDKLKKVCGSKITPDDLMTVMAFESGLSHVAVNPYSGATGFIQFMPSTAVNLGTSVYALKKMTPVKQMNYVYKYLKEVQSWSGKIRNLGDLYMSILWPQGIGKKDSWVLWYKGSPAYTGNSGLDVNHDGKVTRGETLIKVLENRKSFVGE